MSTLQLDLFAGKVLTTKQIEQAAQYVIANNKIEKEKYNNLTKIEKLFAKYGLSDYIRCDYRIEEKTYTKTFNTYSDRNQFDIDIEVNECKGGIKIIYKRFNTKTQKAHNIDYGVWVSDVDFLYEKIQMSSITNNYRYYKFSSIKKKIDEYNDSALRQEKYSKDVIKASGELKADMEKQYPNAIVTEYFADIKEWDQWRNLRCVKVTFQSGSYVEYKVYSDKSKALLRSKDMQKETVEQMINRFNMQEKI